MKNYKITFSDTEALLAATVYYMKNGIHFTANEYELTITLTGGY